MTLPASYDAWRLSPPEEPDFHPGPHRNPLTIEAADMTIDAWGWYDGDGALESVEIDGKHITPEAVQAALALLGQGDFTKWAEPLDADTLAELSNDAAEAEAEARADWLRDAREAAE